MIGQWDNTGVLLATLPACFKNGGNPTSYTSGSFPLYGARTGSLQKTIRQPSYSGYNNGNIVLDGACANTFRTGGYVATVITLGHYLR